MRGTARLPGVCVAVTTFIAAIAACGDRSETYSPPRLDDSPRLGRTTQDLIAQPELYTGSDLPNKTLVLTFDDGPGPATFTDALSAYLKSQGISATFFVNGACIAATALPNQSCPTPAPTATQSLAKLIADGHTIANHSTTHRDFVIADPQNPDPASEVLVNQRVQEVADTDALIAAYTNPSRLFFRAPYGSWGAGPFNTISASAMNKYIGPIYWVEGGGPTDTSAAATMAADWECWQNLGYTTKQCGDRYLKEINANGNGIVLMHDAKCGPANCNNLTNTNINAGVGNTLDMVKYLVPLLKAAGYTFTTIDKVPSIAAALPPCNAACATCSGPGANQCTSCAAGKFLSGGTCTACATCAAGTYQTAACTATANTTCAACTVCPAGSFASTACGGTTNATCSPCKACGKGFFQSSACTATTDATCDACDPSCTACAGPKIDQCGTCPAGFYLNDGECKACTLCPAGSYASAACSPTKDTTCAACAAGTFTDAPGQTTCGACAPGTFASSGATKCETCGNCDDGDACTTDTCAATGCAHAPIASCGPGNGSSSGDADAGTPVEGEDGGGCSIGRSTPNRGIASALVALAGVLVVGRRRRSVK